MNIKKETLIPPIKKKRFHLLISERESRSTEGRAERGDAGSPPSGEAEAGLDLSHGRAELTRHPGTPYITVLWKRKTKVSCLAER